MEEKITEIDLDNKSTIKWWAILTSSINSILEKIGKVLPWVRYWLNRPIIYPNNLTRPKWRMVKPPNGKEAIMYLDSDWNITNGAEWSNQIVDVFIIKPERIQGIVATRDTKSNLYGEYLYGECDVPSKSHTKLNTHFQISPPLCSEKEDFIATIVFVDKFKQERKVKNIKFKSDNQQGVLKILKQESVYNLNNNIEKQIAFVLQDEITRYKRFGRRHGELGSVHATYQGKEVKSIYQDRWYDHKSGKNQEIVLDPENSKIESENGDALVALFHSIKKNKEKQQLFIEDLLFRLDKEKEYYCVCYLILYVLFRIGKIELALNTAKNNFRKKQNFWQKLFCKKDDKQLLEVHQRYGLSDFNGLINGMLRYEHYSFKDNDLDLIEEFILDSSEPFQIKEKLNSIRSYRLLLRKHNDEI